MRLFLTSYFAGTTALFEAFAGDSLAGKTVAFISTAANREEVNFFVEEGRTALTALGLRVTELDIATAVPEEIAATVRASDLIYVSGGNTFYLLHELRRTGTDALLREAVAGGKLYVGESAGMLVLAPQVAYARLLDEVPDDCRPAHFDGLGWVDFYPLPHDGEFPFEEATAAVRAEYAALPLRPIDNSQALVVEGASVRLMQGTAEKP